MFEDKRMRMVISKLAQLPSQWMTIQQLEFSELSDLEAVLGELVTLNLAVVNDEKFMLNEEQYFIYLKEHFSIADELLKQSDIIKERASRVYLQNPLVDKNYDLGRGVILLVSDYENDRYYKEVLRPIIEAYDYTLKVKKSIDFIYIGAELRVI